MSCSRHKVPFSRFTRKLDLCNWIRGFTPDTPENRQKEKSSIFPFTGYNRESNLGMTKKEVVKRQKEIKIRLTDEEHEALLARCTKPSLATWMREICLGEKQTKQSRIQEVDPQLLRQLAGIGNNLNQIARIMNQKNQTGSALDRVAVMTALAGIERELQAVRNDYQNS